MSHLILTPSASATFVIVSLPCLFYTFSEEVTSTFISTEAVSILKATSLACILSSLLVMVEVSELHTFLAMSGVYMIPV